MVLTIVLTEKRLPEIMGPVASFIVKTAAQFSSNADELFANWLKSLAIRPKPGFSVDYRN